MSAAKDQAEAMQNLATAQRRKAIEEYGRAMIDDPTSTDCRIKLERFVLAFRAEHEAMCEVYRAMRAGRVSDEAVEARLEDDAIDAADKAVT